MAPARTAAANDARSASGPAIYVFDAYGTLFDVHSAVARHRDAIGPAAGALSETWRSKQLEYTWVRSLMGRHRDFQTLTADALDYAAARHGGLSPALRAQLLEAYLTLDAYPEVRPVLEALKAGGAALAILSNGTPEMLEHATRSAGLADLLDAMLSIEAAGIYKPDPRVYRLVLERFRATPDRVSFQSSNAWDVAGAAAFGFRVLWINRSGQPPEYPGVGEVIEARDLNALLGHSPPSP